MKMARRFHIATEEDIIQGKTADIYFERTKKILLAKKIQKTVVAEFMVKNFPNNYPWGVLAGVEEAAALLKRLNVDLWSMPEGTIFGSYEPVFVIEGKYIDFGIYETAILGFLCQASGIATKAARMRKLAKDKLIISFGARRMHPALSPMIDRSAYIGGCDGVSVIESAELLGIPPTGTIPHALVLLIGDVASATKAFHEVIEPNVRRVALVDTFGDEKFEALNAAKALGKNLYAVRLDTPYSRRGDFLRILKEVRWELDLRGFRHVKLFVSGGINENHIAELSPVADAFGIGTAISNAPVLDFAMDIVEIEGEPIAKRGKMSGRKDVLRCKKCYNRITTPRKGKILQRCPSCRGSLERLLLPLLRKGKLLHKLPQPKEIRSYVLSQLNRYEVTPA